MSRSPFELQVSFSKKILKHEIGFVRHSAIWAVLHRGLKATQIWSLISLCFPSIYFVLLEFDFDDINNRISSHSSSDSLFSQYWIEPSSYKAVLRGGWSLMTFNVEGLKLNSPINIIKGSRIIYVPIGQIPSTQEPSVIIPRWLVTDFLPLPPSKAGALLETKWTTRTL